MKGVLVSVSPGKGGALRLWLVYLLVALADLLVPGGLGGDRPGLRGQLCVACALHKGVQGGPGAQPKESLSEPLAPVTAAAAGGLLLTWGPGLGTWSAGSGRGWSRTPPVSGAPAVRTPRQTQANSIHGRGTASRRLPTSPRRFSSSVQRIPHAGDQWGFRGPVPAAGAVGGMVGSRGRAKGHRGDSIVLGAEEVTELPAPRLAL